MNEINIGSGLRHVVRVVMWVFLGVFIFSLGLFGVLNLPGPAPRADVALGITFSARYAEDLGLDWQKTYLALLDEVGVRNIRIPVYWNEVESVQGTYDFSKIDWQLSEASKRNAKVILSIGQRVPRWPECHIPEWAKSNDAVREEFLLQAMRVIVKRYQENPTVTTWQVENEPFLVFFGECPPLNVGMLDREIALVKNLDPSRPVLTTDSGELSLWVLAAKRGDIFGTTMYRHIYKGGYGYFTYPIGPNFFIAKEWLVRLFTKQTNFVVIELQAEPWASGWVANVSLEEQFRTMDEKKLLENVEYAKRVGFSEIYLWGAEWWYWLKEKKEYPAVWEEAKKLFRESV